MGISNYIDPSWSKWYSSNLINITNTICVYHGYSTQAGDFIVVKVSSTNITLLSPINSHKKVNIPKG